MSILDNRRVANRLRNYPDRLARVDRAYETAINSIGTFAVDPHGDVKQEAASFETKLREYELALTTCVSYAKSLENDLKVDIAALKNSLLEATGLETTTLNTTILTLETELLATEKILAECDGHIKFVRLTRRTLATITTEQNLARLIRLAKDLQQNTTRR